MPNRIELTDTAKDIITKLAQGNPGALTVLVRWLRDGQKIDPLAGHPMVQMCWLDDMDIVGPRIWVLYKNICDESLPRFVGVLRARQLGFLQRHQLQSALDGRSTLDVDALLAQVVKKLPEFYLDGASPKPQEQK